MSINSTGGVGKAIASTFIPGLGQFCDGRNKAGAGYMVSDIALGAGAFTLGYSLSKDIFKASETLVNSKVEPKTIEEATKQFMEAFPKAGKVKCAAMIALPLVATGVWIANIVDAYKGNRK